MICEDGDKYVATPSNIYNKNQVTFRDTKSNHHYSEYPSVKEAVEATLRSWPKSQFFVFASGVEMAKWILE